MLNPKYFEDWCKKFRKHQLGAWETTKNSPIGQVIIPTGAGKTFVQVAIHVEDMLAKTLKGETGVYVIAAHRLLLCQQLLNDFVDLVVKTGLSFDILFVGTLNFNIEDKYKEYMKYGFNGNMACCENTTNQETVLKAYNNSKAAGRHLVIASTYHSFFKLRVLPEIDVCTYDEAHTTTQEDFTQNIKIAQGFVEEKTEEDQTIGGKITENIVQVENRIKRNYFFTATRKFSDDQGMNDVQMYGEILYQKSPREMVDAGEIVGPKLHFIDTRDNDALYTNTTMLVKTVIQSFQKHRKEIKLAAFCEDAIEPKILICANGSDESRELHDNPIFQNFCQKNDIQVFLLNSRDGYFHNFQPVQQKITLLNKMRHLKDNQKAILIHIRMLTEGIDLPSITGVMPLRNLGPICLFQTIGRGSRLVNQDRYKIYNQIIGPDEKTMFIKPFCWVILPIYYTWLSDYKYMVDVIRRVYKDYGYPFETFIKIDKCVTRAEEDPENITDPDKAGGNKKETDLIQWKEDVIETIVRQIQEDEKNAKEDKILHDEKSLNAWLLEEVNA
jgi:superfamily II DNA or RNA helicase